LKRDLWLPFRLGYLTERNQLQTHPLSVLSDSRLGIDASYYLQQLIDTPPSREPLLAATGGMPLALTTRIEADLRALEKAHIKPVFVFPGLIPNRRWKPNQHNEHHDACRDRREAWTKYEGGQEDAATRLFEGRSGLQQWDFWRMVLRIFRHRNVEFLVAPYLAWAQVCLYMTCLAIQFRDLFLILYSSTIYKDIKSHTSTLSMDPLKRFSIQVSTN
jgi:hypothetical protein